MYNVNMKKKKKSFGGIVAAGTALAGAALGVTAAILSSKKNQDKIKKTVDEVSHGAVVIGKNIKEKADKFKKNSQKSEKEIKKVVAKKPTKVVKATKSPVSKKK